MYTPLASLAANEFKNSLFSQKREALDALGQVAEKQKEQIEEDIAVPSKILTSTARPLKLHSKFWSSESGAEGRTQPEECTSTFLGHLVNLFGTKLLSFLVSLKNLPTALGAYDFTDKDPAIIVKDLTEGVCKVQEALVHATTLKASANADKKAAGHVLLDVIAAMKGHVPENARSQGMGHLRFLFFTLANFVIKQESGQLKFTTGEEHDSDSRAGKSVSVCLPKSESEFHCILNLFTLTGNTVGMFNILAFSPFLHEFILRPMARHGMSWQMGYELLIAAFQQIEESTTGKSFADIMEGSHDTLMRNAERQGAIDFPNIFRTHGGNPERPFAGTAVKWNGKFTKNAKNACKCFNEGSEHTPKMLNADGTCKYNHVCNKWISPGGPWGRCGGGHKASKCDHPDKCDEPVKA